MDPDLGTYRDRFTALRTGFVREVDQGVEWIHKILDELGTVKAALEETKLDLSNEREVRRRLQQEAQDSKDLEELQGRRPFVVVLIDADADSYVFHDRFITMGERGGQDAADELLMAVKHYLKKESSVPGLGGVEVLVRAFANVSGLGAALQRNGRLGDAQQLRAFTAGFSNRNAFFDFVDIGPGKERADLKIRESIKFFLNSFQCKHLVLACAHDAGYAPFLGQLVGEKQVAERITLVEGYPFPAAMRDLRLKTTQFSSVFTNMVTQPAVSAGSAGPMFGRGNLVAGGNVANKWHGVMNNNNNMAVPYSHFKIKAQSERLGPVVTDQAGRRVDKPFPPSQPSEIVIERLRGQSLCYHLFLRGECVLQGKPCRKNHAHAPLTEDEFYALWALARKSGCFKSRKAGSGDRIVANDCSDPKCVYGHLSSDKLECSQSDESEEVEGSGQGH